MTKEVNILKSLNARMDRHRKQKKFDALDEITEGLNRLLLERQMRSKR